MSMAISVTDKEQQCADWWQKPRRVSVVVDNPSWILPFAERLVEVIRTHGDTAALCRSHDDIPVGDIAFYLGCVKITPPEVLGRNRKNLVVHESALPKGRGFSPLTWQILAGENVVPIVLLEMDEAVDAGPVIFRCDMVFEGHELIDELHAVQGKASVDLCRRYLDVPTVPIGVPQAGDATYYPRRQPQDSRLDASRSLAEQFNLLRTVDNRKYPAYFDLNGHRYRLSIEKGDADECL